MVFDEGKMLCEGLRRGHLSLRGSSTGATGVAKVFGEGDESRGPAARATSVAISVIRLRNWLEALVSLECRRSVK